MSERSGGTLYGGVEIPGHPDLANIAKLDRLAIPLIRRAHRLGIAIDREHFYRLSSEFSAEVADLEKDIASYIPVDKLREFSGAKTEDERADDEEEETGVVTAEPVADRPRSNFNASSPEQIGKLLYDILGIGVSKKLKKTASGKLSTGKKQLEMVRMEHPVVAKILRHRELTKLDATYCKKLPKVAVYHPRAECCPVCELKHRAETWRVHTEMVTTRTETGRIASRNPNLQNIPGRTKQGTEVRAGFIASPGTKLVSVDFSQIELRMMAHLANCYSMIVVYEAGGDLHDATAMQCFGLADKSQIDKVKHRIAAKIANFLSMYQGGDKALYQQLVMAMQLLIAEGKLFDIPDWLTVEWCAGFQDRWFEARPEVRQYLDLQTYRARRYGMVWDIFGRIRLVPEVQSAHSWIREAGIRQAGNVGDQASSAGLMKLAMGACNEFLLDLLECGVWCWPLLTIHDQLITEVEEDRADMVLAEKIQIFDSVMNDVRTGERLFRVPIESDGSVMERWAK